MQKTGCCPTMKPAWSSCVLAEANKDNRYNGVIRNAEAFIRQSQWSEKAGKDRSDLSYGGTGYGKDLRPDLSNTAYFIDALKACGNGADDPEIQKALIFVSRCQNFESGDNTTPFAAKNPDGGFYYTCVAGGGSPAGKTDNGGLRSYGSMTYSGLKSMIYAGVKPDDPRVKAAMEWVRKNYDVKNNPGLGQAGLYYYYNVFAKSLDALGVDLFEDAAGKKHDWRRSLPRSFSAGKRRTVPGSTAIRSGWRAIRIWRPDSPCWPSRIAGPRNTNSQGKGFVDEFMSLELSPWSSYWW